MAIREQNSWHHLKNRREKQLLHIQAHTHTHSTSPQLHVSCCGSESLGGLLPGLTCHPPPQSFLPLFTSTALHLEHSDPAPPAPPPPPLTSTSTSQSN